MTIENVARLHYRVEADEILSLGEARPIDWEMRSARIHIDKGAVTCELKFDAHDLDHAMRAVEDDLKTWAIFAGLKPGTPELSFTFTHADIVANGVEKHRTQRSLTVAWNAVLAPPLTPNEYLAPPTDFEATPDVRVMWDRYIGYRHGKEPLASMAYFCWTVLEMALGGLERAVQELKVSRNVLTTLRQLTSSHGSPSEARKRTNESTGAPYSDAEKAWIEHAVRTLIRRMGEYSGATDLSALAPVTMADLPRL